MAHSLYKSIKYFRNPALRFDNLVYAYGQIGYLSAAIKGIWKTQESNSPSTNLTKDYEEF